MISAAERLASCPIFKMSSQDDVALVLHRLTPCQTMLMLVPLRTMHAVDFARRGPSTACASVNNLGSDSTGGRERDKGLAKY